MDPAKCSAAISPFSEVTIFVCSGICVHSCCGSLQISHQVNEIMFQRLVRRSEPWRVFLRVITPSRPYVKRVAFHKPSAAKPDDKILY